MIGGVVRLHRQKGAGPHVQRQRLAAHARRVHRLDQPVGEVQGGGGGGNRARFGCEHGLIIVAVGVVRSEEHTSELQSLMRISYAVFCLDKKKETQTPITSSYET